MLMPLRGAVSRWPEGEYTSLYTTCHLAGFILGTDCLEGHKINRLLVVNSRETGKKNPYFVNRFFILLTLVTVVLFFSLSIHVLKQTKYRSLPMASPHRPVCFGRDAFHTGEEAPEAALVGKVQALGYGSDTEVGGL